MFDFSSYAPSINRTIHYDATKPAFTHGNIYNNQGEGIAFYVQVPNEGDSTFPGRYLIAEMRRQLDGSYILDYSNSAFGNGIEGLDEENSFYVTPYTDGRLYFRGRLTDENSWVNSSRFMVTTLQDGDIRPGDDFLFQFALKEKSSVTGIASEEDFCAVYDHKMLWRANLYMDEGPGDVDWNNRHPWDSEDNEWNVAVNPDNYDDFVIRGRIDQALPDSYDGNGGQVISFPDYSPVRVGGNNNGRVAYDYPDPEDPERNFFAYDSPFDFTYKLLSQRENIEGFYDLYATLLPDEPFVTLTSGDDIHVDLLKNWEQTIAPADQWRNYRTGPFGVYSPYLPGVGLYWKNDLHGDLSPGLEGNEGAVLHATFEAWYNVNPDVLSAGVDCVGFAKRAASYNGAFYSWGQINGNITEGAENDSRVGNTFPIVNAQSYRICDNEHFQWVVDDNGFEVKEFLDLDKIVPGDVFYYQNGASWHIAIINNTNLQDNGIITSFDIELIESYYWGERVFVNNDRSLSTVALDDGRSWYVVRLKKR